MRLEVYLLLFGVILNLPWKSRQDTNVACRSPMAIGMGNGRIPDSSITASSIYAPRFAPFHARLGYKGDLPGIYGGWFPKSHKDSWIQVDLEKTMKISHVVTQGRVNNADRWIKTYKVSHSNDGVSYKAMSETFTGNVDNNTPVSQEFSSPLVARFIKIHPESWTRYGGLRMEIYGCTVERDCLDLLHGGYTRDGVYTIFPNGQDPVQVYCDQTTNGGGFAVFQRRLNGDIGFNENWENYKTGFGDSQNFWLGNEKLHSITTNSQQLLIEMEDFDNEAAHASYDVFSVGPQEENYILRIGQFSGTAGDSLQDQHNGQFFSASDKDEDAGSRDCASEFSGAWWFNQCHDSHLNGVYMTSSSGSGKGIVWSSWKGQQYSLKKTAMKIRSQKERDWNYDLDFMGISIYNLARLPKVTGFKEFTVCWWMKATARKDWSTVFSLFNTVAFSQVLAFSYRANGHYRLILSDITSEFNVTEWPIANDYWHHVCITWTSTNGEWVFYVDGLKRKAGYTEAGVTLQGGVLVIGQLQTNELIYDNSSSFSGLLSRFNMWDKRIQNGSAVEKIAHACSAESGNVVPWPEVYLRIEGKVVKQTTKLCSFPEMHRWDLSNTSSAGKFRDLLSGRDGVVSNNNGQPQKGILSLKNTSFASIDFTGGCITEPSLCEQGLSVSFWLRHTRHDNDSCPENWKYFQGSCYYISSDKANMEDSQSFCKQHGADLVKLDSEEERTFLHNLLPDNAYIGLVRSPINSKMFVWMDGSSLTDPKWDSNQPSNDAQQSCTRHKTNSGWGDCLCANKNVYVCEKDDARHIISSRGTASSDPGLSFYYHSYTNSYKLSLSTRPGHVWDVTLSDKTLIESGWILVTFTWNDQHGLRLHVGGGRLAVAIKKTFHDVIVVETNVRRSRPLPYLSNTFTSLVIGKDATPDAKPAASAVEMSDLRVWETVLSTARIQELYQKSVQSNEWYLWTGDRTAGLQWQMSGDCRDDGEKGRCEKDALPTVRENLYLASNMTLMDYSWIAGEHSFLWRVDVGKTISITEVVAYFDKSSSASRPHILQVRVGSSVKGSLIEDPLCGPTIRVLNETRRHVRCAMPRLGQYVTIQLSGNENLTLTGVEVHRTATPRASLGGYDPRLAYKLVFPRKDVNDYVLIERHLNLSAFSICFWMKATVNSSPHLITISTGANDEIFVEHRPPRKLAVGINRRNTAIILPNPLDQWHHTCVTWKGDGEGTFRLYIDGILKKQVGAYKPNFKVDKKSAIVIGQDQDEYKGGFEGKQAFHGELANLNMWDYVLESSVVYQMAASICDKPSVGNVFGWPELLLMTHGDVKVELLGCLTALDALMTSECNTYTILSEPDREKTFSDVNIRVCDNKMAGGWYRFSGLAGDQMADSCVPINHCGTEFPGWMKEAHPTLHEGVVSRTVCFHQAGDCCHRSKAISVRNCGSFYVYKLEDIAPCNSRYCGAKPVEETAYKLIFTRKSDEDYVALDRNVTLSAVTVCAWMKMTSSLSKRSVFSLSTKSSLSKLQLQYIGITKELEMTVNDELILATQLSEPLDNGTWHHVCVTWDSNGGASQIWLDASQKATGLLRNGHVISGAAILVVGQSQGSFGGGFDGADAFVGELTQVDMWSYVLDEKTISRMVKFCEFHPGDVVAWKAFRGFTRGRVAIAPSNCPTAPGKNLDYAFSEGSLPAVKGTVARFEGPYVVEAHNCLRFRYHMLGEDIGRLNVFLSNEEEFRINTLLWRQAGNKMQGWKTAMVPVKAAHPYKVIFESITGSGYQGDIAVEAITLGINEYCKLHPKKSQLRMTGIKSGMIDHILSYQNQLTEWIEAAGFGGKLWVPCYGSRTDGWDKRTFFKKCSERGPSLTLIRKGSIVFGGFTDQDWQWQRNSSAVSSSKSFLFSLRAVGSGVGPGTVASKFELFPSKHAEAIAWNYERAPLFGSSFNSDLAVALDTRLVTVSLSNSYNSSNYDPSKLFTGHPQFNASEVEVLIIGDSLCDPPCERGATCDEILGRCVCDPSRRDEELCELRIESQKKRDALCSTVSSACIADDYMYAKYERVPNDMEYNWRCFAESSLTNDHAMYDAQKKSECYFTQDAELKAVSKDQSAVNFDKLLYDSLYYWPLDDKFCLKNIGLQIFGPDRGIESVKRGLQNQAIGHSSGQNITLIAGTASVLSDPFDSPKGVAFALWLYYKTTDQSAQYVFLISGTSGSTGVTFYQPDGKSEKVVLEIRSATRVCRCTFDAPSLVWKHYVFTWSHQETCAQVRVYVDGKLKGSVQREETAAPFSVASENLVQIGGGNSQLTEARYDDILIWSRFLLEHEVRTLYEYYKGAPNLKALVSLELPGLVWSDSFKDPESKDFQNVVKNITSMVTKLYPNNEVKKVYEFRFSETSGRVKVNFTVSMSGTGYSAIKSLEEFLRSGPDNGASFKLISFKANDIATEFTFTAENLTAQVIQLNFTSPTLQTGILQYFNLTIKREGSSVVRKEILPAGPLEFKLEGLIGFTSYTLTGVPWTLEGPCKEYKMFVRTEEGVPDAPPVNVSVTGKSSSSISFKWYPVPADNQHGVILGYRVTYDGPGEAVKNITVTLCQTFVTLTDMEAFSVYSVRIAAFTKVGSGPYAVINATSGDGAPVAPPVNLTASLHVDGSYTSNVSIDVSWLPIPVAYRKGVLKGYIITMRAVNGSSKTAVMLKSDELVTSFNCLPVPERFTLYNITVAGSTVAGNSPRAQVYFVTPEDVPSAPPQNISIRNGSSSSVNLTWSPVHRLELNGVLRGYRVQLRRVDNPLETRIISLSPSALELEIKNLTAYTRYSYCIQALTIGYGKCVVKTFITDEKVPSMAPQIVRGYNTSSTSIKVVWRGVSNNSVHGILRGYAVMFTFDDSEQFFLLLSSCPKQSLFTREIRNLKKFVAYTISIAAFNSKGPGPFSKNITVVTDEDIPDAAPQNISTPKSTPDSLTLSWGEPNSNGKNGKILGYRLTMVDTMRNKSKNMTVYGSSVNMSSLFPYTSYEVRIVAFTSKGASNVSSVIQVKTEEAAPSEPPKKVKGRNSSSTGIQLNWEPVDELFVNGKVRSYLIYYFETNSVDKTVYNVTIPVEDKRRRRRAVSGGETNFEIKGLKKYTTYTVQIAANTVAVGVKSPLMNVTTAEDVPSRWPENITAYNTSSTSLRVEWQPVQSDHLNGILRAHVVSHRRAHKPGTDFTTTSTNAATLATDLGSLGKFKEYEIRVQAVTVGNGVDSPSIFSRTDQDIPDSPPVNFTAFPWNTTAIKMKWRHVPEEEQNGIILGYRVKLYDTAGSNIKNITVQGSNTTSLIIGGLEIWTNYSSKVRAFTIKGNGPWSSLIPCRTAEEAPRFPPTNVTAYNTSSTSLNVTWWPVNRTAIRGILRGYRVFYTPVDTVHPKVSKNVSVGPDILKKELHSLYKYTNYSITVAAFTISDGVSEGVFARTHEDRPDKPPNNVRYSTPSSTTFLVEWEEVPLGYRNGIIRSYTVQYVQMDGASLAITESVGADTFSLLIPGLKKFHYYNISVWANTSIGGGVRSPYLEMTDQDVPDIPPPNVTAENHVTTHTIPLQWKHIPTLRRNGILLGYRIRYKIVNMGEYDYIDKHPKEMDVGPTVSSVVLTQLENFAVYEIRVTGYTVKGEGPQALIYAETCRCVKRLTTSWTVFNPYVIKNASGLLPPVFNDMVVECCRTCKTHGKSWVDFDWDGHGKPALKTEDNVFRKSISQETDFHFPVYGYKMQDRFQQVYGYIGLVESPGIAYIVNTDLGQTISNSVLKEIFGTWPLIILCLMFAYLAGLCLWVTERWFDSTEFPKSFISGAAEGLWWAFVTMTTVGYGDRTAVSIPGRVVGIAWTLIGLVINGILVSALCTALTSVSSNIADYKLYGSKVAAIPGSPEYHLSIRKNAILDTTQTYENYQDIQKLLMAHEIEGALIDAYAVGSQKHLFEKPFLRINKIYDYGSTYGAVMGGDSRKLQRCFDNYIPMNIAKIFKHVESIVEQIEEPKEALATEISSNLFDSSSYLYQNTLKFTGILLGLGLFLGVVYEFFRHRTLKRKVAIQDASVQKAGLDELRGMLETFQETFSVRVTELRAKHRQLVVLMMRRRKKHKKNWYSVFNHSTSKVRDSHIKTDGELIQEASEALCIKNEAFLDPADDYGVGGSDKMTHESEA